jgi:ADP-ribose pyrophosphatase YjhB (NUDIX family)
VVDIPCVGAVIRDADGRLLVVRRANPPSRGLWSIPGGRVEPGETPVDAVRREVREETGLEVEVGPPVGSVVLAGADPGDRYLVTDYATELRPGSAVPTPGDDADAVRWVGYDDFLTLDLAPGLAAALQQWGVWANSSG